MRGSLQLGVGPKKGRIAKPMQGRLLPKEETGQRGVSQPCCSNSRLCAEGQDMVSLVFIAPPLDIGLDSPGQSVQCL